MAVEHEHASAAAGQQVRLPARFLSTTSALAGAGPAHQQHLNAKRMQWVSLGQRFVPNRVGCFWEQVVEALLDWLIHKSVCWYWKV